MSRIGGLRALFNKLLGQKGLENLNEQALAMRKKASKAKEFEEIPSWEAFLEERNMVPKGLLLSSFADLEKMPAKGALLRVQASPEVNVGRSYTPQWMGTHFDASGGTQVLDILGSQKRTPTKIPEQYLIEADIDKNAKFLPVSDFEANNANSAFWQYLLDDKFGKSDTRRLQEALQSSGVQGLIYPNFYEGALARELNRGPDISLRAAAPAKYAKEARPMSLEELLQGYDNPSVTVFDPSIVDVKAVGKKQGGLVQYSGSRK